MREKTALSLLFYRRGNFAAPKPRAQRAGAKSQVAATLRGRLRSRLVKTAAIAITKGKAIVG